MDPLSIAAAGEDAGDRPLLVFDDRVVTFSEAAALAAATPIEDGFDSFVASADLATLVRILAALERSVPFAPLHPRWTEADRERARAALALARRSGRWSCRAPSPLASVLFTSGTTGGPKGVVASRAAWVASVRAHAANLPFERDDRWLLAMPLSHAGGLSIVMRALVSRTGVVVRPAFDPEDVEEAILRHRVTCVSVVPSMLARILDRPAAAAALARARVVLVGGAGFPAPLRARCASAGIRAFATYGMTETCSQIATARPGLAAEAPSSSSSGSSGAPLPGFQVRIVDATGAPVAAGLSGRILVRGPALMEGYLADGPRDAAALFDTGDEGWLDERGALTVLGRADETIVTGGENVHPSEVEAVFAGHPGVESAVVFGVPDEVWGAVVAVALVLGEGIDPRAVLAEVAPRLARFRRPRRFAVVSSIPVGPSGKVSRRQLARDLRPELAEMRYRESS